MTELNHITKYYDLKHDKFREELVQSRILENLIISLHYGTIPTIEQLVSLRFSEIRDQIKVEDEEKI